MFRWCTIALIPALASVPLAAQDAAQDAAATQKPVDFAAQIQPILRDRCYQCHGVKKQEGELRLDLKKFAFGPDEDLWVVIPGEPDDSVLIERITLPKDDPDIMPNEGEPLTKEQIALIQRWIAEGADWPETADQALVAELARRKQREMIEVRELDDAERAREAAAIEAVRAKGALAVRVAANTTAVEANFSLLGKDVTDADVATLAGLEPSLVWLNLARTGVTDAGLAGIRGHTALRRLNLSNTAVTDAGLECLAGLTDLEYLNLYGTEVTNAGLEQLRGLTKLRKLFLWQTGVDAAGARTLSKSLPELEIDLGDYATLMAEPVAKPINETCPVSGQPADAKFTVEHDGQLVAFCCEKCLAKFQKDPEPFLDKLPKTAPAAVVAAAAPKKPAAETPVNETCPVSGQPADAKFTVEHDGQLIAFCCEKCLAKFQKDPKPFLDKLPKKAPAAAPAVVAAAVAAPKKPAVETPVNETCPVSGQPADAKFTVEHDGQLIAFCCEKCLAKFQKDPKPFLDKLPKKAPAAAPAAVAADVVAPDVVVAAAAVEKPAVEKPAVEKPVRKPVNATCPFSGRPIDPAATFEYEGQLVAFCCNNCKKKFAADPDTAAARVAGLVRKDDAPRAIATANVDTLNRRCPFSGDPIDPAAIAIYDGKAIGFCNTACRDKFVANPDHYLAQIPELRRKDRD